MVKMKATIDMQRDQARQLRMEDETHRNEVEAVSFH